MAIQDYLRSRCEDQRHKKTYRTKKAAIGAAHRVSMAHGREITYYKCPDCREFHLTSQVKRNDKNS